MTRLLYVIPSRARPLNLLSTICTAWRLRSGAHDIRFASVVDTDDDTALHGLNLLHKEMPERHGRFMMDRPDALGVKWNRPLQDDGGNAYGIPYPGPRLDPKADVDAALLMTDRMIPITPGWDDVVAKCLDRYPNRVLWWRSPSDPGTVAPVVPRSWLEAMDWKPAVELFPAWWIDTWLMELDRMVFGGDSLMMPCHYAGERKTTMELRDCGLWCRYYAALRPQRVEQSKVIAARLGVDWQDRPALLAEFGTQDAIRIQRAPEFEKVFGDQAEPWEGYRRIKAVAQVWMDTRDQPVQTSYEITQRLTEAGYPMDGHTERAIQTSALEALAGR